MTPVDRVLRTIVRDAQQQARRGDIAGDLPVLARVHGGGCLVDLRSVPESGDARLVASVGTALVAGDVGGR